MANYSYRDMLNQLAAQREGREGVHKAAESAKAKTLAQNLIDQVNASAASGVKAINPRRELAMAVASGKAILPRKEQQETAPSFAELAEQAQKEYDDYIQSDTYKRNQNSMLRRNMLNAAMAGVSIAEAPITGFLTPDPTEQELKARADYFRAQADKEHDDAVMAADMEEFGKWTPQEQESLRSYIDNGMGSFNAMMGGVDERTQTALQIEYMALSRKYGADTVKRMVESISRSDNAARSAFVQEAAGMLPDNFAAGAAGFVGARAANMVGNITSPLGLLTNVTRPGTGRYTGLDPNNMGNMPNVLGSGLDAQIAENIRVKEGQEPTIGREVFATVYQAGASAVDSWLRIHAGGGSKNVSRALIAGGSFGRAVNEYSGQGASPAQALLMGIVDAGLELLTEEVSLDRIIQQAQYAPATFMEWLKNTAISGGIEVSEEELSLIGSTIAQAVFMGDRSAYHQQIGQAVAEGMDYTQAKALADLDWLKEGAETAIQSFLSGSMMSGAAGAGSAKNARRLGKNLSRQGIQDGQTRELLEAAKDAKSNSPAAQLGRQLQGQKTISKYDQGRLYQAAMQDEDGAFDKVLQKQFEDSFKRQMGIAPEEDASEAQGVAAQQSDVFPNVDSTGIEADMDEGTRHQVLSGKKITVVEDTRSAAYADDIRNIESLPAKAKSRAEKIIRPLAEKLGILRKGMKSPAVEIEFQFSKNKGLKESLSKQLRYGGSYADFAKALSNLDQILQNAVLVERHGDKYAGTSRADEKLEGVYVLLGACRDGDMIIPVQMEIKKSTDTGGGLYMTVAMTKIEADVRGSTPDEGQARSLLSASEYSLADIFRKINPADGHFLKYVPDGFLSEEQRQAKKAALQEDAERIAGYKKNDEAGVRTGRTAGEEEIAREDGTGITQEQQETLERLGKFTGRKLEYFSRGATATGMENGFYQNGTIFINTQGKDPKVQVFSHELTHSIEIADSYSELAELVFRRIQERGGDREQMRREKKELYAQNGHTLSDADADAEIVAQFVADHLLTDEQSILTLVRENRSLGQKIRGWFDRILARFGNENAQERIFVQRARDLYTRALDQTRPQNPAQPAAVSEADMSQADGEDEEGYDWDSYREVAAADFAAGRITQEKYDEAMEFAEQMELQESQDSEDRKYSFAGVNARTADMDALAKAKELEKEEVSMETIRQQTGWFRGMDGKWRFEVDDRTARTADGITNYMKLGELLKDARILEEYPDLGEMEVVFQSLEPGVNASYDRQFDCMNISYLLKGDPEAIRGAVLHEIQHAVQAREDFTGGTSVQTWERRLKQGFDSRRGEDIRKAAETERRIAEIREADPEFYQEMMELDAMAPDLPRGEVDWDTLEPITEDPPEWKAYDAHREALEEKYGEEKVWDFYGLIYEQERNAKIRGRTATELYFDTAGEIEARNVAGRRNLTAEERKKTPPILGDEDTVFAEETGISFEQSIAEYPYNMQTVIRGYIDAVDPELLSFVSDVDAGRMWRGKKVTVGTASEKMVADIERITGVHNQEGCKILMNTSTVLHIKSRHGANGEHDDTMRDNRDIARINYILQNYDSIKLSSRVSGEYKNRDNSRAKMVVLSKKINGTYFVVEAVPDTGKISVVTAYMDRNRALQVPDENTPSRNVQDELAPTLNPTLAEDTETVKQFSISPVAGDGATEGQQAIQQEQEDRDPAKAQVRMSMPAKARGILEGKEREFLRDLGDKMYVPRVARRDWLKPIVQKISNAYLQEGKLDQDQADLLFDEAYAHGIIVDAEFYEQYKHIRDYLKSTGVTLSQRDQADIADFPDFKHRARYRVKIQDKGGLPVDSAWQELRGMAQELFPESITHPADQLQHMVEVARSIEISEKTLSEYFGDSAEEFRKWARGEFDGMIRKMARELWTVKRYADEAAAKAQPVQNPVSKEQIKEAYRLQKEAKKVYERVSARNLLTDADQMEVGRLLRGEILPEHLNPDTHNADSIRAVYEAKKAYEEQMKIVRQYRKYRKAELRQQADTFLETALTWKDKATGLAYARETMQRNLLDIIPDKELASRIYDEYFGTVRTSEAEATRFKTQMRDRVRALNLSTKVQKGDIVSESHAVQLYGEAMDNIAMIRASRGRMKIRDGKTEKEWIAVIQDLFDQSPSLDRGKIESAVETFRQIYDELFERMNEVRIDNGYEPINYRKGYFPHFQPGDGDSILLQFGKALGLDTQVSALPTTINGLTHTFRPGMQWFGNAQERLGFNTAYDALEGFDKYIEGAAGVIFHTENIQKLRALESQIRYRTSEEGIRKQVDAINADDRLTEDEKRMKIEEIYKNGRFTLSNFANELTEYTNLLAGKKSRLDRTVEALMGRKFYTIMKNLENRVGANMVAGNLGSALTNFIPLTQAGAQLDRGMILKGMWDTLRSYKEDDGLAGMSSFLTNRQGSDTLIQTWTQKASKLAGMPMELIDGFVSGSIVRAAYQQNLREGLSETEAMYQADLFAAGVMADRSRGAMPTLFESRNPIFKAFTQFQLEVNNQFSEVFKDLPRRYREKGLKVLTGVLLRYFLGAFLYNEVFEHLFGRRPAMDPIGILNDTVGDWTGYELPNLVDAITGKDTSLKTDTEAVGFGQAMANMGTEVLGQLPFSSGLTLLGVETDGGRIPVSSAIPNLPAIWKAATAEGWSGEKRWHEVQQELKKLAYVLPPFAGGQIFKTWKGVKAFLEGGSYSVNNAGEDILQYPIFREEDGFTAFMQAAILGKSSLAQAQDWVEGGFDSFSAKQTAVYQDMTEAGVSERQAYDLIRRLETVQKTDEQSKAELQRDILLNSELDGSAVAVAYYGLLATDADRVLMDAMTDRGADGAKTARALMQLQNAEKSAQKREVLLNSGLTEDEKHTLYREKISEEKEDEISQLRATGLGFDEFLTIQNKYAEINEQYSKASEKARVFSHWVNSRKYTDRQAAAVRDNFSYYSMVPATAEKYDKLVQAGVTEQSAYSLVEELEKLKPKSGKTTVDDLQKYRVIVDSGLTESKQMDALEVIIGEGLYQRVSICQSNGVAPSQYLQFREVLPEYDANGNGSFSQKEIQAALDSIGNSGADNPLLLMFGDVKSGMGLTNAQKAVIWQSYNKTWKPNKNPYDKAIGQRIYNLMNGEAAMDEVSQTSGDFGEEVLRQLLEGMK